MSVLSLLAAIWFGYNFFSIRYQYTQEQKALDTVFSEFVQESSDRTRTLSVEALGPTDEGSTTGGRIDPVATPNPHAQAFAYAKSLLQIDFEKLKEENKDTRAWIYHPAANINYPVLMGEDNSYYLTHNFENENSYMGSIYYDYRNKADFSDKNTIIYGHNLDNNYMFSKLVSYQSQEFAEANPFFLIYTPQSIYKVDVAYGIVEEGTDPRFLMVNFRDEADFQSYIDDAEKESKINGLVEVSTKDQLVTLFTCTNDVRQNRFIVMGKLTKLGDF